MPTTNRGALTQGAPVDAPRHLRDVVAAAGFGTATACLLALCSFLTSGNLTTDYPWLYIFQMPGTEIALRLFGKSGLLQGYSSALVVQVTAILIQAFIVGMMTLGALYIYRLVSYQRGQRKSDGS
jgi:hypothetical protein